jgi:hypothetical protein
MQYEGELVNFLDQLTLSDDDDEYESEADKVAENSENVKEEENVTSEAELASWVVIEKPVGVETSQPETVAVKEVLVEKKEEKSATVVAAATAVCAEVEDNDEERPQVYLRWDIQDQFLRFVAHALCAFYGLVSFSK